VRLSQLSGRLWRILLLQLKFVTELVCACSRASLSFLGMLFWYMALAFVWLLCCVEPPVYHTSSLVSNAEVLHVG
jgi:hypothetical protein